MVLVLDLTDYSLHMSFMRLNMQFTVVLPSSLMVTVIGCRSGASYSVSSSFLFFRMTTIGLFASILLRV
jgi:cytochrome c oxidase subunit IV